VHSSQNRHVGRFSNMPISDLSLSKITVLDGKFKIYLLGLEAPGGDNRLVPSFLVLMPNIDYYWDIFFHI
jgi:hypothetical protein